MLENFLVLQNSSSYLQSKNTLHQMYIYINIYDRSV